MNVEVYYNLEKHFTVLDIIFQLPNLNHEKSYPNLICNLSKSP